MENGFTLYRGVLPYEASDETTKPSNPISFIAGQTTKIQDPFDTGEVADAQGILSAKRDTVKLKYVGQFNALGNMSLANLAGNWGSIAYITHVHSSIPPKGYSTEYPDTLETLSIRLEPGNYSIAASGAFNAKGFAHGSMGLSGLQGYLSFEAKKATDKLNQNIDTIHLSSSALTVGTTITATAKVASIDAAAKIVPDTGRLVSYSTSTPEICSVTGNEITGLKSGNCFIAANQAGDVAYNPAQEKGRTLYIGKRLQYINFGTAPKLNLGGITNVSAYATSTLPVSITSLTTSICTVIGKAVTGVKAGICELLAEQAGDLTFYKAKPIKHSMIIRGTQAITFGAAPDSILTGKTGKVSAKSSSALAVSFSSVTPRICSLNGAEVTAKAVGRCIVVASQAGNDIYKPASNVRRVIRIKKGL